MPKKAEVNIKIIHNNKTLNYKCRKGLGFQALSVMNKTPIEYDCRKADCGICIIRILKGQENLSPPTSSEQDFLKAMKADSEERFACQCRVLGDITVELED
jgi:ferredoxin